MVAMLAGCTRKILEPGCAARPGGDRITLTISAVTKQPAVTGNPQTKISYGSVDATWEEGDKIFLIKSDGTTIELTLSGGAGTSTGTFNTTDPVVAGTFIPYAVSAGSLTKGFVSVADGVITLDLSAPGGGTLADALEHDILKGDAVVLEEEQESAEITGLTTHILSYLRFRFEASAKAVATVGLSSPGGVNRTVTIAANGTVSGSAASTDQVSVTAALDGGGNYAGYFAYYGNTTTALLALASDEDGKSYSRLVSCKDEAVSYDAGTVYGKTFTLTDEMMTSDATGTQGSQDWKDLGLSVRWAKFNVGSSSEYSYDRNMGNLVSGNRAPECVIPAEWAGWRIPTRAEVQELFHASARSWVSGTTNGVRFDCNENYVAMGAGGRARQNDASGDWEYGIGNDVCFYIDETGNDSWGNTIQHWVIIGSSGNSMGFGSSSVESRNNYYYNQCAMRLVCDY